MAVRVQPTLVDPEAIEKLDRQVRESVLCVVVGAGGKDEDVALGDDAVHVFAHVANDIVELEHLRPHGQVP